MAADFTEQS